VALGRSDAWPRRSGRGTPDLLRGSVRASQPLRPGDGPWVYWPAMTLIPYVIETTNRVSAGWTSTPACSGPDHLHRHSHRRPGGNVVMAQLLFLAGEDPRRHLALHQLAGGSVYAGLAIYDTMQYVEPRVGTICMAWPPPCGGLLPGRAGLRYSLPTPGSSSTSERRIQRQAPTSRSTPGDPPGQPPHRRDPLAPHRQAHRGGAPGLDRDFFMSSARPRVRHRRRDHPGRTKSTVTAPPAGGRRSAVRSQ